MLGSHIFCLLIYPNVLAYHHRNPFPHPFPFQSSYHRRPPLPHPSPYLHVASARFASVSVLTLHCCACLPASTSVLVSPCAVPGLCMALSRRMSKLLKPALDVLARFSTSPSPAGIRVTGVTRVWVFTVHGGYASRVKCIDARPTSWQRTSNS